MKAATTFSFDENVTSKLNEIAEKSRTTKTEILRRAITLYDLLEKRKGSDNTITIKDEEGKETELILP